MGEAEDVRKIAQRKGRELGYEMGYYQGLLGHILVHKQGKYGGEAGNMQSQIDRLRASQVDEEDYMEQVGVIRRGMRMLCVRAGLKDVRFQPREEDLEF